MAQTIARGVAWSVLLPVVVVAFFAGRHGMGGSYAHMLPSVLAAMAALVIARPVLEGDEAKRAFAPVAMRSWLLASATAAIALAVTMAELASAFAGARLVWDAMALFALAASLLASGVGVIRMRTWGVLLGMVSSVMALVSALHFKWYVADWLVLGATVPGLMMVTGIIAARLGLGRAREDEAAREEPRVRVDVEQQAEVSEEDDAISFVPAAPLRRLTLP